MGLLVEGRWQDVWYSTKSTGGRFVRKDAAFRNWITVDGSAGPTGIGGFNASYDPAQQALAIRLRVGLVTTDGLTIDPTTGIVTPATADFAAHASDTVPKADANWPKIKADLDSH